MYMWFVSLWYSKKTVFVTYLQPLERFGRMAPAAECWWAGVSATHPSRFCESPFCRSTDLWSMLWLCNVTCTFLFFHIVCFKSPKIKKYVLLMQPLSASCTIALSHYLHIFFCLFCNSVVISDSPLLYLYLYVVIWDQQHHHLSIAPMFVLLLIMHLVIFLFPFCSIPHLLLQLRLNHQFS